MCAALAAHSTTSVGTAFLIRTVRELAGVGKALLAAAADTIARTRPTVLVAVAQVVSAPWDIGARPTDALVVIVTVATGPATSVVATVLAVAGHELADIVSADLATATAAIIRTRGTGLAAIAGIVSAPRDVHTLPVCANVVLLALTAGGPAVVRTTLASITGSEDAFPQGGTGLSTSTTAVLRAGPAVLPVTGRAQPVTTAGSAVLRAGHTGFP